MKKSAVHEQQLMDALKLTGRIDLAEARRLLGVSESTIRRLFTTLEASNNVIRVHGAIQLEGMANPEYRYDQVEGIHFAEKKKISICGVQMIQNGDVVYLDSGTTLAQLSALLASRIREEKLSVTVFTNSIVNLEMLSPETEVSLIGGRYRSYRKDFCGYIAEETVKNLHFTKSFLGTDGYNVVSGFTATDFSTARLNQLVLSRSDCRIILADSSKFQSSAVVSYSRDMKVDVLITNEGLAEQKMSELATHCSNIRCV